MLNQRNIAPFLGAKQYCFDSGATKTNFGQLYSFPIANNDILFCVNVVGFMCHLLYLHCDVKLENCRFR